MKSIFLDLKEDLSEWFEDRGGEIYLCQGSWPMGTLILTANLSK